MPESSEIPPPFLVPRPRQPDPEETPGLREEPFETTIDTDDNEAGEGGVRIDVDGGYLTGLWQDPEAPPGTASLVELYVADERRGKGTHLVGVFAREAIARGATALHSTIINKQAMRNRARIFGEHNLTFVGRSPDGAEIVLPMTSAQASMSIQRAEEHADRWDEEGVAWPSDFDPGISTRVNLMSLSVRIRIGLPPAIESPEPRAAGDDTVEGKAPAVSGRSVEGLRRELSDHAEVVRGIGDVVLGSSATLRDVLLRMRAALEGTKGAEELIAQIEEALNHAGLSVQQLNAAIEELRRYDRDIGG